MLSELQDALSHNLSMHEVMELAREARQKIRAINDWPLIVEAEKIIYKLEQKCIEQYTAY